MDFKTLSAEPTPAASGGRHAPITDGRRVCLDVYLQLEDNVLAKRRFHAELGKDNVAKICTRGTTYEAVFDALIDPMQVGRPQLQYSGAGWVVAIPGGSTGHFFRDETYQEAIGSVALALGDQLEVECEGYTLRFACTPEDRQIAGRGPWAVKGARWAVISAAAHVAVLALAFLLPPDAQAIGRSIQDQLADRLLNSVFQPPEPPKLEKPKPKKEKKGAQAGGGKAAPGPKGAKRGRQHVAGRDHNAKTTPKQVRDLAVKAASHTGLLGILSHKGKLGPLSTVMGEEKAWGDDVGNALGDLTNDTDEYGGLDGTDMGLVNGGGCTDPAKCGINLNGISTKPGRGPKLKWGPGGPGGDCVGKHCKPGRAIVPIKTVTEVKGGLTRAIIRRVIRRNIKKIKYCYEKELQSTPSLEGRIKVHFTIDPFGRVPIAGIVQSSMNNRTVETCVVGKVRTFAFPRPEGGGVVKVRYPFQFHTAGR